MIVVSDTSALSNLIQVQQLPILAALFKQIIIPQEVYKELCEITTQKQLIDNQNWILVQPATNQTKIRSFCSHKGKGNQSCPQKQKPKSKRK